MGVELFEGGTGVFKIILQGKEKGEGTLPSEGDTPYMS